jgi:polyvinyl alcohol dehydrogenase (cytochrome)
MVIRGLLGNSAVPFSAVVLLLAGVSACSSDTDALAKPDAGTTPDAARPPSPDWPSYGHDEDNSRANVEEHTIARSNVGALAPRWSFSEAAVTSTPSVYRGTVYFGDWNSALHAVDAKTGESVWATLVQPTAPPNQINDTPYVTEDAVYIGAHTALLSAVQRMSGEILWQTTVDDQAALMLWSSPVVIDDLLLIGVGSYQVFLPTTPPFRGNVVGVDAKSGAVKWKLYLTEGSGVSVWSSAAVDRVRKLAFIGTGQEYSQGAPSPNSDALVAIRYETGELVWSQQFTMGDRFQVGTANGPDFDVGASPNLFEVGGRALVGVGDKGGRYFALDRDTGAEVWHTLLTPGGSNGGVMASTAHANGVIYVASNNGSTGGAAGVGGGPGEATIFALDAADGAIRWRVTVNPGTFGGLAVANGLLFVPTLSGEARAYDTDNGNLLWAGRVGESMGGGVSVAGGMIYAGHGWNWLPSATTRGGLVAFGLP